MPRKPTGKPSGRPRTERANNGEPNPVGHTPSDEAQRALDVEISHYRLQPGGSADDGVWPVLIAASQIAREADVTTRAVQKWRKTHWYQVHFWSAVLNEKLATRSQKTKAEKELRVHRQKLVAWIAKRWPHTGYVDSPINGRRYNSPELYAQHLRQEGAVPNAWLKMEPARPGE